MEIIYGNILAESIKSSMKQKIDDIRAQNKRLPLLSVVLVGNNPASMSYVRGKEKACSSIGMLQKTIRLDENVSQEELSKCDYGAKSRSGSGWYFSTDAIARTFR